MSRAILVLNAGSSSVKFALFALEKSGATTRVAGGTMERIGQAGTQIACSIGPIKVKETFSAAMDRLAAADAFVAWLERRVLLKHALVATGHRVVHGLARAAPAAISGALLAELTAIVPFAEEHLPLEIALMRAVLAKFPALPHVACFDTAFHASLPRSAALLPIPRRFFELGVRRYGFHGLSYAFLMAELARLDSRAAAAGRIVLCHLGNGASMAAVLDGKCVDTTMSLSPTAGLVMGTRCGDIDPSVVLYMSTRDKKSPAEIQHILTHESGLVGLSGGQTSDMRDLLALRAQGNEPATDAVAVFVHQARKFVAALAASLGGLDTLVFAGGIGENSSVIRSEICASLAFLGVELSAERNDANAARIDSERLPVAVRVIRTNEELTIVGEVQRFL